MLTILKYPNPILTQKCESVLKFDDELKQFCNEMILTMNNAKGIGLAASQVGKLMRVIVTDIGNKPMIFINPIITASRGEKENKEGCLSFPGLYVKVNRAESIHVSFQDQTGEHHTETFCGLYSVCIQHELDHLDGIVFIDKLSPLKKSFALKKFIKHKTIHLP